MLDQVQNRQAKQWGFYAAITAIVCVSWSFYASVNYPLLNSDDGMNILMAHYYDLPGDIYCWGQDRLGSLIPLIAQLFIKVFGTSAITAVSLSNYAILLLGYIGFSSMLKTNTSKLLFAVIWFLPYERFIDINRFIIGVEYSLIAFAVFLIMRMRFAGKQSFGLRNHVLLAAVTFVLGIAVWASDLAIVTIGVLLFTLWLFQYRETGKLLPRKEIVLYVVGGTVLWTFLIMKAKSYAVVKTEEFASLNSFDDLFRALSFMKEAIWKVLAFKDGDFFLTAYAWLLPALLVWLLVLVIRRRVRISGDSRKFAVFLLLDVLAILGVILISHWVLINEMGRRYFVATYISLSMLVLIAMEHLVLARKARIAIYAFLALVVTVGAISPLYTMKFISVKTLRPTVETAGEYRKLGRIGIIAEYWNAYRTSCGHLDMIKATPHDKSDVRNPKLVEEVFAQPNLYVVKDMWMDEFPDTLQQFGFTLVKDGGEFYMGGCFTCKYRRLSLSHTYTVDELKTNPAFIVRENGSSLISVNPSTPDARGKHLVFGPEGLSLLPGKYKVRYCLKVTNITTNKPFAIIDISGKSGEEQLLFKDLTKNLITTNDFVYIDVALAIAHRTPNVEFRLIYSGNADVVIKSIELIEL